jgi:hypothetical protein
VRKLLVALVVLIVLVVLVAVGLDLAMESWAQSQLAARAKKASGAASATAHVGNFPVLYRALAQGVVPEVRVDLRDVPVGRLHLNSVHIDLQGVSISRHALVQHHQIQLGSIELGVVTATATASELSGALGRPVKLLANGDASVSLGGKTLLVKPELAGNGVLKLVSPSGLDAPVPIPRTQLVPCVTGIKVSAGRMELSCTLDQIPAPLARGSAPAAAN